MAILIISLMAMLTLAGTRSCEAASYYPSGRAGSMMTRESITCEDRQTPGFICESCDLLSMCVKFTRGWRAAPVAICDTDAGFYCDAQEGRCSNATGPCHPLGVDSSFACTSQGIFPDPFDCQKWHFCYVIGGTLIATSLECPADKAFDPATGQCTLPISHPICRTAQFQCSEAGDAAAWPNNPNIFYICNKAEHINGNGILRPELYKCDDGEIFENYFCKPKTEIGMSTPVLPPLSTQLPNNPGGVSYAVTTVASVPTTTSSGPVTCSKQGLQPDPENCRMYYYCSALNGIRRHMSCPDGTYYNVFLTSCSLGTC